MDMLVQLWSLMMNVPDDASEIVSALKEHNIKSFDDLLEVADRLFDREMDKDDIDTDDPSTLTVYALASAAAFGDDGMPLFLEQAAAFQDEWNESQGEEAVRTFDPEKIKRGRPSGGGGG